jgi:hypothetical protein
MHTFFRPCLVSSFLAKTGVNFHGPGDDKLKICHGPEYLPTDGILNELPSGILG